MRLPCNIPFIAQKVPKLIKIILSKVNSEFFKKKFSQRAFLNNFINKLVFKKLSEFSPVAAKKRKRAFFRPGFVV